MSALEVRGLCRRFRSGDVGWLDVLCGVDLRVARGELVAVLDLSCEARGFQFDAAALTHLFATSIENRTASSISIAWLAPVAQPGTGVSAVMATPTTGALVAVHGCMIELR